MGMMMGQHKWWLMAAIGALVVAGVWYVITRPRWNCSTDRIMLSAFPQTGAFWRRSIETVWATFGIRKQGVT